MNSSENAQERSYTAFISYRHKPLDKEAAERIQRSIEHYTVPKEFRDRTGGKRLGKVFRDEDELPISSNLSDSILYALDHSEYLIVVCTPDLPLSRWCEQEIRYFISTHDRDHVIAVLADGDPEKSFSPLLLHTFDEEGNITGDIEPLAANIAGDGHRISNKNYKKEIVRIYAALLGCPFDALWQRERRARTNRMIALMGIATAAMAVFLGVVLAKNREIREQSGQILEQNEQIRGQNDQIKEQNQQITDQNWQITTQNIELQRKISQILVDAGYADLEKYNVKGALQNGLDALLDEENAALYDRRAEALLNEALGAYQRQYRQSSILYEHGAEIAALAVPEDGSCVLLLDQLGKVCCVELPDGTVRWTADTFAAGQSNGFNADPSLWIVEAEKTVICKNMQNIVSLSLEDGSVRWEYRYQYEDGNNFFAMPEDRSRLALLDLSDEAAGTPSCLRILDSATGAGIASVELGSGDYTFEPNGMLERFAHDYGAVFSEDSRYLDVALIATETKDGERAETSSYFFFQIDLREEKILRIDSFGHFYGGTLCLVSGMQRGEKDIFCALYCYAYGGVFSILIPTDDEGEITYEFNHQSIRSEAGLVTVWDKQYVTPMLADENIAVVFLDNSLLLYDRTDAVMKKSLDLMGAVREAYWLDPDEEIIEVLLDNGAFCAFDLEWEENSAVSSYMSSSYDQNGILLVKAVGAGLQTGMIYVPDGGMFLTVREEHPEQILMARDITDPAFEPAPNDPETVWTYNMVQESPSGERVFIFYDDSEGFGDDNEKTTVVVCNALTGVEIARQVFPVRFRKAVTVTDDSHFLYRHTVYGMDGSVSYLEIITEENKDSYEFDESYFHSARLSDGRVVSVLDSTGSWNLKLCPCWIDGKLSEASDDPKTGFAMISKTSFGVGANGFVVAYGSYAYENEAGETVKVETPGFVAYDILQGVRSFPEDQLPEAEERKIVIGTEKPLFVCTYEDGSIYIYDLEEGTAEILEADYAAGEIINTGLAEGDDYLLVITAAGRLDIYETEFGTLVSSLETESLKSASVYNEVYGRVDTERNRLYVFRDKDINKSNGWICIDTETWIVTAECSGTIYDWLPGSNCLYMSVSDRYGNRRIVRVPVRSLDELAEWAGKELGEPADGK